MGSANLLDLPPELFHNFVFKHLSDVDIYNLRKIGCKTLHDVSKEYVQIGKF